MSKRKITCPQCGYTDKVPSEVRAENIRRALAASDKRIGRPERLDEQQKRDVLKMFKRGYSKRKIAIAMNVSCPVVLRVLRLEGL